ncbi:MAG: transposase [Firmicutes bacterium]|nr:transposase [Bacillota bacterium]
MHLTLTVKLQPNPAQTQSLLVTMERFNAACNAIAETAFREHTASHVRLHRLMYREVRERFGLSAQMAVRAIGKVVEVYKRDKSIQPTFRPHGAIVYDDRLLSWKGVDRVSLLTLTGRIVVPVMMGTYHTQRLCRVRGQADLIYRDGAFYLAVVVDVPEPPPLQPDDWLGVDLGIVNIAADSDGQTYAGGQVNGLRSRHQKLRQRLQQKGTKSAKRLVKKRRRKEHRFATDVNHCIAKQWVTQAQDTRRGIALEDLTGIRDRITVHQAQRRRHHSWAFHQLRTFITYKATLAGVPVVFVNPRNTSRTCPHCGLIDKRNRPNQASFQCIGCGFAGPADTIAARNIASRAAVNRPHAGSLSEIPASSVL